MPQVTISQEGFDNVNDTSSTVSYLVKNVERGKSEDMVVYVEYDKGDETNIQLTGFVRDNEIDIDVEADDTNADSNTTTLTSDGTVKKQFNLLSNEDMLKLKVECTGGSEGSTGTLKVGVAQYND